MQRAARDRLIKDLAQADNHGHIHVTAATHLAGSLAIVEAIDALAAWLIPAPSAPDHSNIVEVALEGSTEAINQHLANGWVILDTRDLYVLLGRPADATPRAG